MLKLSASQIKQYVDCRFQYFDKYRLFKFGAQDTSGLYGTAIHKAIEMYYRNGSHPMATLQKTLSETLANWQDKGKDINYRYSYADMIGMGREMLEGFNFEQFTPKELEYKFNLPFIDNVEMRGYIDLITDDGILVDFKTAGRKPKSINNDWQFAIYSWAYRELNGVLPTAVYWYHMRDHSLIAFDTSKTDQVIEQVVEATQRLVADTFEDVNKTDKCSNCAPWCIRKGN